jgi:trk system potassium uptake protein TrkH
MNYARVLFILGTFLYLFAGILLAPALCAWIYGEFHEIAAFLIPAAGAVILGFLLRYKTKSASRSLYRREGLLVVVGCWLAAAFIGALPFLVSGSIPGIADAIFESASGFTTTGSTILRKIEGLPHSILFWRSLTQWVGGMCIVLLFVAVLPALGVGGRLLYEFEVSGVDNDDLKPRIRATAMALWKIYLGLTLLEIFALLFCGLSVFDAINHSFTTISTGGYSTYDKSVAHFRSPIVEIVITLFMFASGVNFGLFHRMRAHGARVLFGNREFQTYTLLAIGVTVLSAIILRFQGGYDHIGRATLDASFQVVSLGTSTGFGTADFDRWPNALRYLLVIMMFVGGCAGSTAGGIKVIRILVLFKALGAELQRFVFPNRVRSIRLGGQIVNEDMMRNALAFFFLTLIIFSAGASALMFMGVDMESALTGVAATLFNIGPGLG